jgi:hypothetical protein
MGIIPLAAPQRTKVDLFVLVAEVGSHYACLQVFERAEVFDDVAAGIIKKQLTIFSAPDCDNPFKIVPVLKQIIDSLGNATAWDNRDFRTGYFFLLRHRFGLHLWR